MNIERWGEYKKRFLQDVVVHGVETADRIAETLYPMGCAVPGYKLEAWLGRLMKEPRDVELHSQARLVNRFKLGADPEFVFVTQMPGNIKLPYQNALGRVEYRDGGPYPPEQVQASQIGLKQGRAFGADNNGRLAEVRPYPSRSALDVVASLLSAMRWMAITCPDTRQYEWQAGAYKFRDGLGGHVHFGRKRPTSPFRLGKKVVRLGPEMQALDVLSGMFERLGMFNPAEMDLRRQGDQYQQQYGLAGDFRMQGHGYEYRTLPSWLDSPWMAFFVITLCKLAVLNPAMVLQWQGGAMSVQATQARLKNLLRYYRGVDDDALLASRVLEARGVPVATGKDFRKAWGCGPGWKIGETVRIPKMIPAAIPVDGETRREVFEALIGTGGGLVMRVPKVTWSPANPLQGYEMLLDNTDTAHRKGLGEMIWDVVVPAGVGITMSEMRDVQPLYKGAHWFALGTKLARMLKPDWRERLKKMNPQVTVEVRGDGMHLWTGAEPREAHGKEMRKLLLSGVFPVWRIGDCQQDSFEKWQAGRGPVKEEKVVGKCLYKEGE